VEKWKVKRKKEKGKRKKWEVKSKKEKGKSGRKKEKVERRGECK